MRFTFLAASILTALARADYEIYQPEQIHLALRQDASEMSVQWSAAHGDDVQIGSTVMWGLSEKELTEKAEGDSSLFVDGGDESYTQTHHIAVMSDLTPSTKYYYKVGDTLQGWSDIMHFTSAPSTHAKLDEPKVFGIWGDMGSTNAQILHSVTTEVQEGKFDMILHVGDFAYNMDNDNGRNGDVFMKNIQPMSSHVPYMVDVGNHEVAYDFSHYTERFRNMPSNSIDTPTVTSGNGEAPNNWFYSHDFGNVHFVAISTEIYFDYPDMVKAQEAFVEADLAAVDRTKTPWVIVHGHRPLYCSCDADCDDSAKTVRDGMEEIFYKYGVDMYICGHEHNYERMYDVYKNETTQSTINPPATTYVVTGDAGGPEDHESFELPQPDRTAFRTDAFGYSRMTVYNETHLFWEQVECDTDDNVQDTVIDSTWLVVEEHGPFGK